VPFHKAITQHEFDATEGSVEVEVEGEEVKQEVHNEAQQQSSPSEPIRGPVAPMGVPLKTTLEIQEFDYQMLEREVLNHMRRNSKVPEGET
jgi:hypothetical protein